MGKNKITNSEIRKLTHLRPMKSAILPLITAPSIAPIVNIELKTAY